MKQDASKGITIMNMLLCFCVIMIHVTSIPLAMLPIGGVWHIIIYTINKLLCFSVPSFIFLSGFKLHSGYGQRTFSVKDFYLKRFKKIIVPYLICVLIYFLYFFAKGWVGIQELPQHILLGTLAAHFYYVIIAVQFYLLFPVLNNLFRKYAIWMAVGSLVCTVFFQQFCHFTYGDRFAGAYLFYFVLGMLLSKYRDRKISGRHFCSGLVLWVAVATFHVTFCYLMLEEKLFYHSANTVNMVYVLVSMALLYHLCRWLSEKWEGLFMFARSFGRISYKVYLYHILLILILQNHIFPYLNLSAGEQFATTFAVLYAAVFLYDYLSGKCCAIRKIREQTQGHNL